MSANDLKQTKNETFNNFKSANKEVKQCVSTIIWLVRNYLKCDGNGDKIQMI